MFNAFDKDKKKIVSASSVTTIGGNYECSTPDCSAKMVIRSIDGKRKPHFYKPPKSQPDHSFNCKCIQKYGENKKFKDCKIDIHSIFNSFKDSSVTSDSSFTKNQNPRHKNTDVVINSISTPKGLLAFGVSHELSEMINNSQTLNEIFIDDRNCLDYSNSISGVKMIVCNTRRFEEDNRCIVCYLNSKNKLSVSMEIKIFFPVEQKVTFDKVIKYILKNANNKFSKFPLAILGDWNTVKVTSNSIVISTTLKSRSHLIYTHI